MTDKEEILKAKRAAFDKWNRSRYHNHTLSGDELAWSAWREAIANYLQTYLDEDSELSDRCLITINRGWAKKRVRYLRTELPIRADAREGRDEG